MCIWEDVICSRPVKDTKFEMDLSVTEIVERIRFCFPVVNLDIYKEGTSSRIRSMDSESNHVGYDGRKYLIEFVTGEKGSVLVTVGVVKKNCKLNILEERVDINFRCHSQEAIVGFTQSALSLLLKHNKG